MQDDRLAYLPGPKGPKGLGFRVWGFGFRFRVWG